MSLEIILSNSLVEFSLSQTCIKWFENLLVKSILLGVQISSVRFPKNCSSCCEWFIVTADFGGFREVKHLLIIFSLYRFEFHTKTLIFTMFEMSNFVLTKQHCGRFWFSALIGRKMRLKPIECLSKFMVILLQLINHVGNSFDVSRMEISALKISLVLDSQKNSKTKN